MSSNTKTLQDVAAVDDFLDVAATETAPLFEHLEFEFLREYDVFAPGSGGEHEYASHQNSSKVLYCYYKGIYGTCPVTRELRSTLT